ncbi:MAG: diacylglycerol/lipid kinase family protein [Acidimicrobiales bacterium]
MTSPFGPLSLIVNPQAGGRKGTRRLDRLRRTLDGSGLEHEVRPTEGPGDATRLARQVLSDGGRFVVAVGGDGTVHEVVNGMLDAAGGPVAPGAVLGVVAAGSGCDFVRTFGLPSGAVPAAGRLAGDAVRTIDVARIGYLDAGGQAVTRYFANIAEAGLGATTAARAIVMPRVLGQSRYLAAFWAVLPGYRPGTARIDVDGVTAYEGRAVNVVAANCRYFGGGMHISPRSEPADGSLELLVFNGRKTDSFTMLPKVYRGRHMPHRSIVELRGRTFAISADQHLAVEADGEVLGTTPVTIDVVPSAITLKV